MMTCEHTQELLLALLDGEASAEERSSVEAHLASCAACQREREEMEQTRRVIGGLIASKALGPDFAKKTAEKTQPPHKRNPWEWNARITLAKWVVAAAVLLAASAYFPMKVHEPGGPARLETRVFSQQSFLAGTRASVRIVTRDWKRETSIPDADVELRLVSIERPDLKLQSPEKIDVLLAHGATDGDGTLSKDFVLPDVQEGAYAIDVRTKAGAATTKLRYPIQLRRATAIYLTTDKPLYQPGQVIHVRALAVKKSDLKPIGVSKCTLEIEDPKGNKILKAAGETSKFGIADTTLQLGDEINLGAYTIRAIIETGAKTETTEKKVTVDRYSLPKFRITAKADKDYYHPQEKVKLHVQADYFFGKPVADASIEVVGTTLEAGPHEFFRGAAKTDATGACDFPEVELPAYFVGQPLVQGKGIAQFEVKLTDPGKQVESQRVVTTVSEGDLQVTAFADGGVLKPGLENTVWVVANYPDGSPAKAHVYVILPGDTKFEVYTDEMGLGTFELPPQPLAGAAPVKVTLHGQDERGNAGKAEVDLAQQGGDQGLRVVLDRGTYKVGESMHVTVLSTTKDTDCYVDVLRNGQTSLTRTVHIEGGKGRLDVELPNDLFGMVEVSAYEVKKSLNIVRDTRKAFVTPAEELKLDIALDKETYKPGEEASLDVQVTDGKGHPVLAALGLWVIDPAVLARAEIAPGLEKVFFLLEKELLKPRVEIHGLSADKVLTDESYHERDRAARALFAASETLEQHPVRLSSRDEEIRKKLEDDAAALAKAAKAYITKEREKLQEKRIVEDWKRVLETYQKAWNEGMINVEVRDMELAYDRIWASIQKYWALGKPKLDETLEGLVKEGVLGESEMWDAWGHRYHCITSFCSCDANHYPHELQLVSAGADGKFGDADDIEMHPNHQLTRGYPATDVQDLVKLGLLTKEQATDPWGTPYHAALYPNMAPQGWASAGPDKKMGDPKTGDDDDLYLAGDHIAGKFMQEVPVDRLVEMGLCLRENTIDPFDVKYVKLVPYGSWDNGVFLQSAGPDGLAGTSDDITSLATIDGTVRQVWRGAIDRTRSRMLAESGIESSVAQLREEAPGTKLETGFSYIDDKDDGWGDLPLRGMQWGALPERRMAWKAYYRTQEALERQPQGGEVMLITREIPDPRVTAYNSQRAHINGPMTKDIWTAAPDQSDLFFSNSIDGSAGYDMRFQQVLQYANGSSGGLQANGGTVDLRGSVINQSGVIQARSLKNHGGVVTLNGSDPVPDESLLTHQLLSLNEFPDLHVGAIMAKGAPVARLREYFPETLFVAPEVLTDDKGHARLSVHLADTITRWEASAFANSLDGRMGSTERAISVFQEFFLDAGLPPYLTQNDTVTIPVSVMNYKKAPQDVTVKLTPSPWYEVVEGGYERVVRVEAEKVAGVEFTLRAKQVGAFALRIDATSPALADAVQRMIQVIPDGREVSWSVSDRLEGTKLHSFTIPDSAIEGASTLLVRVSPGVFAQVVDGMDSMLTMPSG